MSGRSSLQPSHTIGRVALLALSLTLLNSFKPMHVDDTAYFLFARHIAQAPLDPYGFWISWSSGPEPAMRLLAPPVFLYYFAALIKLFGIAPLLWKLSCFPIHFLYLASLYYVVRNFAPSIVWPTLLLIVFSPIVLPGVNMMLDLPAQSLFFAGLACFILACERESPLHLALAALLAALCIETKYTGLIIVPTLVLYGVVNRRLIYGLTVSIIGLALFVAIEVAIRIGSGTSHFLLHASQHRSAEFSTLVQGLVGQLGGGGIGLLSLALLALPVKRQLATAILVGWIGLFCVSVLVDPGTGNTILRLLAYTTGASLFVAMLCGIVSLNRSGRSRAPDAMGWDRKSLFLSLWLLGEIVFYFLVSPFPAMRRVMGIGTAAALLFARWIDARDQKPSTQMLAIATAIPLLIGGVFLAVDVQWARSVKESVAWAKTEVGELSTGQTIWYHGLWGFKYYAMEAGMRPIITGRSRVGWGDYLLLPDAGVALPLTRLGIRPWEEIARYRGGPVANLDLSGYYYGVTPLSIGESEVVRVGLYRRRWRYGVPR